MYYFAEDNKLVEGRNPYRYFKGFPELKFDSRKFRDAIENDDLKRAMLTACMPILDKFVGDKYDDNENDPKKDMSNYLTNILPEFFDDGTEGK